MTTVFVSSTFQDLREHREAVRLALQRLRLRDIAMETYVAEHQRPLDKCLADVRDGDLYVGIFAWRYGFVPEGHDASITELEYREAIATGKDVLIFLVDEDAPWKRSLMDRGDDLDRVEALRAHLSATHVCAHFSTPHELAGLVTAAVANWTFKAGRPVELSGPVNVEDLRKYYSRLQQQYSRLDLDALTPPQREQYLQINLASVFVPQNARDDTPPIELPKEMWMRLLNEGELSDADIPQGMTIEEIRAARSRYRSEPAHQIVDVVKDPQKRRIVVLGDPGSGKSTLARYLVLALSGAETAPPPEGLDGHLPLLIELKTFVGLLDEGKCDTFLDFLDHLALTDGLGMKREVLEPYLEQDGLALFIFDGLDEIFDPPKRGRVTRQIAWLAERFPHARVVVTSRVIGYRRAILDGSGFQHYTLEDLDDGQIERFLHSWYALALFDRPEEAESRTSRLLEAIHHSKSIKELAGNPLLLTILAIIGKHQALPRDRWKLYEHAASVLVEHWDVNRHLNSRQINPGYVDEQDKKEMLRRLAFKMQDALAGNYIHFHDLRESFREYLTQAYPNTQTAVIAAAMIDQFRERNFILSRYGVELYGFVHRAFLEYFCADAIVTAFQRTQKLSQAGLERMALDHWSDPAWREVLRLVCSAIDIRFADALITRLSEVKQDYVPGDAPEAAWNLALAVQCLGEIRGIGNARDAAVSTLRRVILLLERSIWNDEPLSDFIETELLPAIFVVGESWPGKELFAEWYSRRGGLLMWAPITSHAAVIVASLFNPEEAVALFRSTLFRSNDRRANDAIREAFLFLSRVKQSPLDVITAALADTHISTLARTYILRTLADRPDANTDEIDSMVGSLVDAPGSAGIAAIEVMFKRESMRTTAVGLAIEHLRSDTTRRRRKNWYLILLVAYGHERPEIIPLLMDLRAAEADRSTYLASVGIAYAIESAHGSYDTFLQHPSALIRAAAVGLRGRYRTATPMDIEGLAARDDDAAVRAAVAEPFDDDASLTSFLAAPVAGVQFLDYWMERSRRQIITFPADDKDDYDQAEDLPPIADSHDGDVAPSEAYLSRLADSSGSGRSLHDTSARRDLVQSRSGPDMTTLELIAGEDPAADIRAFALSRIAGAGTPEADEFLYRRMRHDVDPRIRTGLLATIWRQARKSRAVADRLKSWCAQDDSALVQQFLTMIDLTFDDLELDHLPSLQAGRGAFYGRIPDLSNLGFAE